MATNPLTLTENSGRITGATADYPRGSAKNDTTGTTGDGTPIKQGFMDDLYGPQQALLRAAGFVPSGVSDTALTSQYVQAVTQLAAGRAAMYDDTGVANSYILGVQANQQTPSSLFDGMVVRFNASADNTGASTADVSSLLGQATGTTVLNILDSQGGAVGSGAITGRTALVYSAALSALTVDGVAASRFDVVENKVAGLSGVSGLSKESKASRAFELVGAAVEARQDISFVNAAGVFLVSATDAVLLPSLTSATDYKIYGLSDGSIAAQLYDDAAPASSVLLGGFSTAYSDGAIVESSIWDVNFRPTCDPRGMVLSPDGQVWADIYLADTDYTLYGYSRPDVTIADDLSAPVVPFIYGGDGVTTYGSLTWFEAYDLAVAAGKRLPHWGEFTGLAYGVVEQQAVGTDPVTTKYQAGHRSACGMEQATGVMWQWGADTQGTGSTIQAITDGRGSVYASEVRAVRLGAGWSDGSSAGSRSAYWDGSPSGSGSGLGLRAVCNHVIL